MIILAVLAISLIAFRGAGALGVESLDSWTAATRAGLALMLAFTASAHFTSMKEDLVRMVPPKVPNPRFLVFLTGLFEIAAAIGLLVPDLRGATGIALILFLVAVFPANVHAARAGLGLRGKAPTPLSVRLPLQLLFIGLTWWVTR